MFVFSSGRKGTAYFEFQYCKKQGVQRLLQRRCKFWAPDSLFVSLDDETRFFAVYGKYLETPDGRNAFDPFGINYYSKEKTRNILKIVTEEKPADWETLSQWLEKAIGDYNGFYFLGM